MFQAQDISVSIGKSVLLNQVSLAVEPGQFVAVIGPNGAGKSTLLKVLCGDREPQAGHVHLDGHPLDHWTPIESAKRRAILPQQTVLTFSFTVLEVVLMGRFPHVQSTERPIDYDIARMALDKAGVLELEDRLYPTLSGGEQQRVQFARALAQIWESTDHQNRYLLLDEPTSSLDLAHQHRLLSLTQSLTQQNIGILCILHDLNLAAQYADTVLILKKGHPVASGPPFAVLTAPIISDAFDIEVQQIIHPTGNYPLILPINTSINQMSNQSIKNK